MKLRPPIARRVRHPFVGLVISGLAMHFAIALAQEVPSPSVLEVRTLLDAGRFKDAFSATERAERVDPEGGNSFELQFLKGAAAQGIAADVTQPAEVRESAYRQSQSAYQRAAELRPNSAATLNNLAALEATVGRVEEAAASYRRAVAVAAQKRDPNLENYAFNFAVFSKDRDPEEAIRQARIATAAPGSGGEPRALLAELYARHQPESLLPFARQLLDEGRTGQVQELALVSCQDDRLPPSARRDWLSLLALAIARDAVGEIKFDPEPGRSKLESIPLSSPVAAGAHQLARGLVEPPTPAAVDWWSDRSRSEVVRTSSRAAMRELLSALGQRTVLFAPAQWQQAERYFRTAVNLGDRGPDPEAFLSLANVYADHRDMAALRMLMNQYQYELFSEKSEAYARNDWPLIFRLHTALGMTYAQLEIWRSDTPYQNAVFQLEAAQRAAYQLNLRAQSSGQAARSALPAAAAFKLAEGYRATGRAQDATRVRIESAETLAAAGRTKESTALIKSIRADEIPAMSPQTKAKFERLRNLTVP